MLPTICFIIIILLSIYIYGLKLQIKSITSQLIDLNSDKTSKFIDVSLYSKDIENLALNINKNLKKQEQLQIEVINHEKSLKQSIANISHDFRTPLTSIMGYIQIIKSENYRPDKKEEFFKVIEYKLKMLNTLINEFFELSIVDSDDYKIELKNIDITALVTEILLSNYQNFKLKNITPEINIVEKKIFVLGDILSCERIIQNLITNALKYSIEYISISLTTDDINCYFTVINKSKNLEHEDCQHLFDRFYSGDNSRTDKSTGLGLYIVKTLVYKMNGTISQVEYKDNLLKIVISFNLGSFG